MAFQIRGKLEVIYPTESLQGKNGNTFYRRSFVLDCTRYNPDTGEPWENHPQFELSGNQCALLDSFQTGQRVEVSFSLRGAKYQDKTTGEWKYFTTISAFDMKPAAEQTQNVQQVQTAPMAVPGIPYQPNGPAVTSGVRAVQTQPMQTQQYQQSVQQYPNSGKGDLPF